MPKHSDFVKIYNRFISDYGLEKGKSIYFAWLHNERLDDTKSLKSQKGYSVDAITGRQTQIQKMLTDYLISDKQKYALIIEKYMDVFYNEGIQTAAQELNVAAAEFGDLRGKNEQIKIIKANSKTLMFNLLDDINKEVGLMITDINLNNIPMTNTGLKKEISSIFQKKQSRLDTQVTTEITRTFNTALEFGYKKSGLVAAKQWVAVMDNKTTQICTALNGEIVEIGKPFSSGDYSPPAHPGCRSRVVPITLSSIEAKNI